MCCEFEEAFTVFAESFRSFEFNELTSGEGRLATIPHSISGSTVIGSLIETIASQFVIEGRCPLIRSPKRRDEIDSHAAEHADCNEQVGKA